MSLFLSGQNPNKSFSGSVITVSSWDSMYTYINEFINTNKTLPKQLGSEFIYGSWLHQNRELNYFGKLTQQQIDKLNKLPIYNLDNISSCLWLNRYIKTVEFVKKYGKLPRKIGDTSSYEEFEYRKINFFLWSNDDIFLYKWIREQEIRYLCYKRKPYFFHRKEEIEKLFLPLERKDIRERVKIQYKVEFKAIKSVNSDIELHIVPDLLLDDNISFVNIESVNKRKSVFEYGTRKKTCLF